MIAQSAFRAAGMSSSASHFFPLVRLYRAERLQALPYVTVQARVDEAPLISVCVSCVFFRAQLRPQIDRLRHPRDPAAGIRVESRVGRAWIAAERSSAWCSRCSFSPGTTTRSRGGLEKLSSRNSSAIIFLLTSVPEVNVKLGKYQLIELGEI